MSGIYDLAHSIVQPGEVLVWKKPGGEHAVDVEFVQWAGTHNLEPIAAVRDSTGRLWHILEHELSKKQ